MSPDIEELIAGYLTSSCGLANVSVEMPASPPMPFYLITRISGPEDEVTDYPVVSIHAFDRDRTKASVAARVMHKHMTELSPKLAIEMTDGSYCSVDHVCCIEAPVWRDYADHELQRYCGRYRVATRA